MKIEVYQQQFKFEWDHFILKSKNGHFLFCRNYMEYHQDRFVDHSLLIRDNKNQLIAVLPAHENEKIFASHQGLTYGGFITTETMKVPIMLDIFEAVMSYLKQRGFKQFIYKTIPHIHHRIPAEEDRYALFRTGAQLQRRDAFSVVFLNQSLPYQERRLRCIKKALNANVTVCLSNDFDTYWPILSDTLMHSHGVSPVHSLNEIKLLHFRFPEHVKLYSCSLKDRMLAGVVIYETAQVARSQYIAASADAREVGALDLLFQYLLKDIYRNKTYFDFGPSNERDGYHLNQGLIDQKEGFGARAIVHDHYQIDL